ncbi:hypothetical protein ACFL44_02665 [Gemmatimonadota bacterium]
MTGLSVQRIAHPVVVSMVFMVLAACSGSSADSRVAEVPLYLDILTLETSMEDDPTLDDYQLVSPDGIGVDEAGNIYVADEYSLKVYEPDGSPLKLIGREGSGPGEFGAVLSAVVGPSGYIAAMDVLWDANIYAPDGEFLYRSRYRNEQPFRDHLRASGFTFTMMREVLALDSEHLLIDLFTLNNMLPGPYVGALELLLATRDTLLTVCSCTNYEAIKIGENSSTTAEFQGNLLWSLADDDRLLYTHTSIDRVAEGTDPRYHLIVLHLNDMSTDTLAIPWTPEAIPPAVKEIKPHYSEFLDMTFEVEPVVKQILDNTEFYPPLKAFRIDEGIVFGFHYSPTDSVERDFEDDDLEVEPHLVDIIDLDTGRLLARAEFPFLPEVIRGGRAYRLYTPEDDFPAVYVYRIDPAIYTLRDGQG